MKLHTKLIDLEAHAPIILLNAEDAKELGVRPLDRVALKKGSETTVAIVDVTQQLINKNFAGITNELAHFQGDIEVTIAKRPESVNYIKKKLRDKELSGEEILCIIKDLEKNRLSDIELGAYVSAVYANRMNIREILDLTKAMVSVGEHLEWDEKIVADKHSIGGVPGNRVTPVIVPIIASQGILIPKTSSRAITSPSGTADTMEVFCDVSFDLNQIKEIVHETNGCIVWGGSVNLSPVDDRIIRAEYPLSLDPEAQVIASVLSKKISAGSNRIIVDIPCGENSKIESVLAAEELARKFKLVGKKLNVEVECVITRGDQPVGNGIGPCLESLDILRVLKGRGPRDLEMKAVRLADQLLELCGKKKNALHILTSGKALRTFKKIVEAQNGDPDVTEYDIRLGKYEETVIAKKSGFITYINNKAISQIARRAGAPKDKGAGIYMHRKKGEEVEKGEALITIYAEKKPKLDEAMEVYKKSGCIRVTRKEEILLEAV